MNGTAENHPRLIDGLIIGVYVVMHVWMLLVVRPTHGPAVLIAVVLSAVALTRRRQRPKSVLMVVTGLAVLVGLLLPELSYSSLAIAIALYEVSTRWQLSRVWGWYVTVAVFPLATRLPWQVLTGEWLSTVHALDLFGVFAVVLGAGTRARRERREASAALMRERLERAAAGERARIAAEMHDVVSHSLSVMIALANGASTGWRQHPARAREALRHLSDVGATALRDTRRILDVLCEGEDHPSHTAIQLPQSLDDLIDTFRAAGLPVTISRTGSMGDLDAALASTVYRIVQESLTNALRHSKEPNRVEVVLHRDADQMVITTTDDGRTDRDPMREGHGLVSIAERAAAFGGESESGPRPDDGWCTRVWLTTGTAEPKR